MPEMGTSHSHGAVDASVTPKTRRILLIAVGVLVAATAIGLVALWPGEDVPEVATDIGVPAELVRGTIVAVEPVFCAGTPPEANVLCVSHRVRVTSGSTKGDIARFEGSDNGPIQLEPGDRIVLGYSPEIPPPNNYYFADFQRRTPMIWLALLFAVAVVVLGRWRGLRALLGLGVSVLVLVVFVLPAILEGQSPLLVAVVGSAAIMLIALYLAHGLNLVTTTAVLGTLASLGLTALLARLFVSAAQLTGFSTEEASILQLSAEQVNIQGLILGGIVIGSLGVLDDVTVTQASAVAELRSANPLYGFADLYRSALRIGRDHIASTVNTLVLAYAGASLPLLILFTQASRNAGDVLTSEVVAVEVIRTLVGSVGLVASVPITTALAAWVLTDAGHAPHAPAGHAPPAGHTPAGHTPAGHADASRDDDDAAR